MQRLDAAVAELSHGMWHGWGAGSTAGGSETPLMESWAMGWSQRLSDPPRELEEPLQNSVSASQLCGVFCATAKCFSNA